MRIKKLSLRNFKGVLDFTLDLEEGKNCSVFGDNATGKSTLFDAFTFLFFGKDSLGKADFEIKTISDGAVVPMIDHEVGGIFEIDGKEVVLKKVYREKYTKKRGSVEQVFDGHETDHYIDMVPKSKGEYQKFIADIAPEELFRLLTSPTHFNEQMKWQDRRAMLLQVCGNVTDSAVIAAHPELMSLQAIVARRSIEDEKKVLMAERKKINDDLQMIPARIDEATKALPGAVGVSAETLMTKARKAAGELAELQTEKSTVENGGAVALKRKELAEIETAIIELKNKYAAVDHGKSDREELQRMLGEQSVLAGNVSGAKSRLANMEKFLEDCRCTSNLLAGRWKTASAQAFTPGGACPTCGQDYPENLVAVQEADFNRAKATDLEKIMVANKENQEEAAKLKENIATQHLEIEEMSVVAGKLSANIGDRTKTVESKSKAPDVTELPEYKELAAKVADIKQSLVTSESYAYGDTNVITEKITTKQAEISEINQQITAIEMRRNGETRIAELKDQERTLAKALEKHEGTLFLLEKFTRTKVSMLDEQINGKFGLVRWRLTEEQINGGLAECCVCTIDGVPYPSLNNAGRIQAGLDIIKTLSAHHGFAPVCFIDNRESVCRIPEMPGQVISLIVSEPDKSLRIELQ